MAGQEEQKACAGRFPGYVSGGISKVDGRFSEGLGGRHGEGRGQASGQRYKMRGKPQKATEEGWAVR